MNVKLPLRNLRISSGNCRSQGNEPRVAQEITATGNNVLKCLAFLIAIIWVSVLFPKSFGSLTGGQITKPNLTTDNIFQKQIQMA